MAEGARISSSVVAALSARIQAVERDVVSLQRKLLGTEDMVNSVGGFHSVVETCRDEVRVSWRDVKHQLEYSVAPTTAQPNGTAVTEMVLEMSSLQHEFTDMQRHLMAMFDKFRSDSRLSQDLSYQCRDRVNGLEAQVAGLHRSLCEMGDVLLLNEVKAGSVVGGGHDRQPPKLELQPRSCVGDVWPQSPAALAVSLSSPIDAGSRGRGLVLGSSPSPRRDLFRGAGPAVGGTAPRSASLTVLRVASPRVRGSSAAPLQSPASSRASAFSPSAPPPAVQQWRVDRCSGGASTLRGQLSPFQRGC